MHTRSSFNVTYEIYMSRVYYLLYYTIVTNDNEPLAKALAHIHVAIHNEIAKEGVALCSIGLHLVAFENEASPLHVQFA